MTDHYTTAMRLCDNDGMVSHAPITDGVPTRDRSYLKRHNRLALSVHPSVDEPFACTGHAHLAGEHIRCTNPVHTSKDLDADNSCRPYNNVPLKAPLQLLSTSGPPNSKWTSRHTCEVCGSNKMELYNYSMTWRDGDVYCHNGHWIRVYDGG